MKKVLQPLIGSTVLTFIFLLAGRQMAAAQTYPYVKGYLSFIIPVVTINKNATTPH